MKLSEAYDIYEQDKKLLNFSHFTLNGYRIQCNLLIRYFNDIDIIDVDYLNLKKYLAAQTHLKPSSLIHRVRFIRSFFKFLHEEGFLQNNPSSRLKEPKEGKRIPKSLTEEEIELLRLGCKTPLEKSLLEFFYTTGCRVGEVYNLKLSDLNLNNRSALIIGKGNKQREVYFSLKCRIFLKQYLEHRKDNKVVDYVFITERKPYRRISISQLRGIIKRIAKNTKVNKNVSCHTFRHSYATHLLNRRMPLEIIQDLLGHQKLETTKIYTHLSGQRRKEEYDRYIM